MLQILICLAHPTKRGCDSYPSGQNPLSGCCGNGYGTSDSVKGCGVLHQLSDCQLLKNFATLSSLVSYSKLHWNVLH